MIKLENFDADRETPVVFNWHVTESCNYSCGFCFAHWPEEPRVKELLHDPAGSARLLEMLYNYSTSPGNAIAARMSYHGVRLNLAGGEPFLYRKRCLEIIKTARSIGYEVSVITNASRISPRDMQEIAPDIMLLGISIDSIEGGTNRKIGRLNSRGQVLTLEEIFRIIDAAREANPLISIKINTVVNAHNERQDFSEMIDRVRPNRWKVFRVLPTLTDALAVTQDIFNSFVDRHQTHRRSMCAEDNPDMTQSYLMINPHGKFFQNRAGRSGYDCSPPILDVGVEAAFNEIIFSSEKFHSRYAGITEPSLA